MNKHKWIWNRPVNYNHQAAANSLKWNLHMLMHSFHFNVNDTRALVGLCLLVMSHWNQIQDLWDSTVTIAHILIGLSLHIHYFIHLSL